VNMFSTAGHVSSMMVESSHSPWNEHGKPQTRAPEHSLACPSYGTNCRLAGRG
jgi:hypothetical protein